MSEGVQQSNTDMMVGTEYKDFISSLTMYPNPVSNAFTIAISEDLFFRTADQLSYIIRDLPGRMVAQGPMTDHRTDIQLGHLHQGVYLVTIYFKSSKVTSSRIIKV